MDCAEITREFNSGRVPSGAAVAEHLKWCPHCRELFANAAALGRWLASAKPAVAAAPSLAVVEASIAEERGLRAYLRSRSSRLRIGASVAFAALLVAREAARGRLPEAELTSTRLWLLFAFSALLLVLARLTLLVPVVAGRSFWFRSVLAAVGWSLPCLLVFLPDTQVHEESGHFALRSLACFGYGSLIAAPWFGLLWAFDRGTRTDWTVLALAAGATSLLANLVLLMHCPSTQRAHLLAGHASIGLAWFLAVLILADRRQRVSVR